MNTSTQHSSNTNTPAAGTTASRESLWSLLKRFSHFSLHMIIAVLVLGCGVLLIQNRAVATEPLHAARVTVQTATIERSPSYQIERLFVGLVESFQNIDVAFEAGGTVSSISVQEGDMVQSGTVLATLDQRSLRAQQEQMMAARKASLIALERADLALQRERDLGDNGFQSKQTLDNARLSVEDASAALVRVDAQLREVNIMLGKTVLKAPYKAIVGERLVDPGSIAASGQPVLRLYELRNPTARIGIPADLQPHWESQETGRLTINGQDYLGRYIGQRPDVAAGTRVIETRFELLNEGKDWPAVGQMAQLHWPETQDVSGYWVPVSALTEGKRGLWSVLRLAVDKSVADKDSDNELATVIREHVEVVHTDGDRAYVTASMPDKVQIVFNGSHRVVPEQRVQIAQITN